METAPQASSAATSRITPLLFSRREVVTRLGSPKLVQRMLYATAHGADVWLEEIRADGRTRCRLFTSESVDRAYERLVAGECPPLMPSERRKAAAKVLAQCRHA